MNIKINFLVSLIKQNNNNNNNNNNGDDYNDDNAEYYILIYIQQDATLHSLFYLETALHVSGGTFTHHQERNTTVSTASGISHTVTGTCRYSGR